MGTYSTKVYEDFYKQYHLDIENAVDCVMANRCSSISEFIYELINKITSMNELDWDDNVSSSFKKNLLICSNSLNKIKDSIDSDFTKSESLYLDTDELLKELKIQIQKFKEKINEEPDKESFRKEGTNLLGELVVKYPGYDKAVIKWNDDCVELDNKCAKLMTDANDNLSRLERIDSIKVIVTENKLSTIPGLSNQIEINEQFRYYMSDYDIKVCGTGNPFRTSGCSVASAAVAFSLAKGKKIDPVTVNEMGKTLRTGADRVTMITKLTELQGLNLNVVKNSNTMGVNDMLKRLENGESTVIARIAKNSGSTFSSKSGHYLNLVDSRVNDKGETEVLVWDAGYKNSKQYRQGWHKLTEITRVINPNSSFFEISENYLPNSTANNNTSGATMNV